MSQNLTCTLGIPANPDIAGIGVRISIYVQALLSLVPGALAILLRDGERCYEAERFVPMKTSISAMFISGAGLLISAFIQAATAQVTVYHALIVLNLSWLSNFTIFFIQQCMIYMHGVMDPYQPDAPEYADHYEVLGKLVKSTIPVTATGLREGRKRIIFDVDNSYFPQYLRIFVLFLPTFLVALMSAFGLWVFNKHDQFDAQSAACTKVTKLMVWGRAFSVTSTNTRTFWLVMYSITAVPLVFVNLYSGLALLLWKFVDCAINDIPASFYWFVHRVSTLLYNVAKEKAAPKTRDLLRTDTLAVLLVLTVFLDAFVIASTEMTIARNFVQSGEDAWTYGQTLSIFLTIPIVVTTILDCLSALRRYEERRLERPLILMPTTDLSIPAEEDPDRLHPSAWVDIPLPDQRSFFSRLRSKVSVSKRGPDFEKNSQELANTSHIPDSSA